MRPDATYYAAPSPTSTLTRSPATLGNDPDRARLLVFAASTAFTPDVTSSIRLVDAELAPIARTAEEVLDRIDAERGSGRVELTSYERAVLLCGLMRRHRIAVRARCGFAAHADEPAAIEQWALEVLDDTTADGWQRLDLATCEPFDEASTGFVTADEAWTRCRDGVTLPESFGIIGAHGWWFVRNATIRDIAARCKVELPSVDHWGGMFTPDDAWEFDRVDELVARTSAVGSQISIEADLRATPDVFPERLVNYVRGRPRNTSATHLV